MSNQKTLHVMKDAAPQVPCSESKLRRMDSIVQPIRASNGYRLYTEHNIRVARAVIEAEKTGSKS